MRPYNYVIVDEVDEVLLDEAESPFVISSRPKLQSNLYDLTDRFVELLKEERDYQIKKDLQFFWLTYHGIKFAESYFRISNLFSEKTGNYIVILSWRCRRIYLCEKTMNIWSFKAR